MGALKPVDHRHEVHTPTGATQPAPPPAGVPEVDGQAAAGVSGERTLRNQLVERHYRLAVRCARCFAHKGEPLDDLVQVAVLGLIKAVDRFDPAFGVVFTTYAAPTIMGELRRHFRDRTWSVHVARRGKDLYQAFSGVADELTQTLQRSPTIAEIAQRAGVTIEEALEALELRDVYNGVPLTTADDSGRSGGEATSFGREERGYEAAEARATVRRLLATLPTERDRLVVRLRFLDDLSQSQIAARLGVSQVQVSRLPRTNLARMRRAFSRERR